MKNQLNGATGECARCGHVVELNARARIKRHLHKNRSCPGGQLVPKNGSISERGSYVIEKVKEIKCLLKLDGFQDASSRERCKQTLAHFEGRLRAEQAERG